jgi:hypothetical protein
MLNKLSLWLTLLPILFMSSCSPIGKQLKSPTENFKYGIIYTSNFDEKSEIVLMSKNWEVTKKISLKVGGLGTGLKKATIYKNKLYTPIIGSPSNPDRRIIEFDLDSASIRYLRTESSPVALKVDNNFLYVVHNSDIDESILAQIDIKKNTIIKKIKLKGVLREIITSSDRIYIMGDHIQSGGQTIYEVSKSLDKIKVIKNQYTAFPIDSAIIGNELLVMNNSKVDFSGPVDAYTILNIKTHNLSLIKLTEAAPYQLFDTGRNLIITHYFPPGNSGTKVTVIDKQTKRQKSYSLENNLYQSMIKDNKFYSTGTRKGERGIPKNVYKYDLENFKLIQVYELTKEKDMVISNIFSK